MRKAFLILLVSFLVPLLVCGQVERITTINGKKYIIHTVEHGNTIYSISKTYAVDESFILEENPFLKEGLKIGQEIKIPLSRQSKTEKKVAPAIQGEFLIHEVQRKETLYSLSRKYGLEIKDILEHNPELKEGLKVGQKLKIPATKSKDSQSQFLEPANYNLKEKEDIQRVHIVQPKETLYSLAKNYGVTMNAIIQANQGLSGGLMVGQRLIIPDRDSFEDGLEDPVVEPNKGEPEQGESFTPDKPNLGDYKLIPQGFMNEYKVAILLPFLVEEAAAKEISASNQVALEFYQGALIALDSLKKQGLRLTVLVYDTKKSADHVRGLLRQPQMSNVNLFIGPLYRSALEPVIEYAQTIGAHVVCPVPQNNKVLFNAPHVSKVPASDITQAALLGKYLATQHNTSNVIMVKRSRQEAVEDKLGQTFAQAYYRYIPGGLFRTDSIKSVFTNGFDFPDFERFMRIGQENIIFTASSDPVLASGLMTHLKGYSSEYKIRVFSLESWLEMDKIDFASKNDLNLTITANTHVDYKKSSTKSFVKNFRSRFKSEPGNYGFLGFDITYFYLKGIMDQGLAFLNALGENSSDPASLKFNFIRLSQSSGFENKGAHILGYKDYELQTLN
ncbi:MAG: PBP1 and LysM peptidoglycan-binding domain-containing protein [Luteibaculum sp.]